MVEYRHVNPRELSSRFSSKADFCKYWRENSKYVRDTCITLCRATLPPARLDDHEGLHPLGADRGEGVPQIVGAATGQHSQVRRVLGQEHLSEGLAEPRYDEVLPRPPPTGQAPRPRVLLQHPHDQVSRVHGEDGQPREQSALQLCPGARPHGADQGD